MKPNRQGGVLIACAVMLLCGCDLVDPNAKPIYGKDTGLPVNCRAYVQASIDGYREKQFTAEAAMNGLERNCGLDGEIWGKRE